MENETPVKKGKLWVHVQSFNKHEDAVLFKNDLEDSEADYKIKLKDGKFAVLGRTKESTNPPTKKPKKEKK